ncbi:MAG TPA: type I 3-dehydroquinate dehydratase [Methanobacterium sp.]|nr:type I 3-dehydroquinate dehydratase [Methanobacterium sp.]
MADKTLICVPIFQTNLSECHKTANKALKLGADILELRVDALQNPDPDRIIKFLDELDVKKIVTNRMAREGGLYKGSEIERTDILRDIAGYSDYVDIELITEESHRSKVLNAANSSIVSYHNFKQTPSVDELLKIVELEKECGDLAKFAVMPRKMADTLKVFEVLAQVKDTIGISMGDMGSYTRVTASLFGSPITFASIDNESAPGQLNIHLTRLFLDKFETGR